MHENMQVAFNLAWDPLDFLDQTFDRGRHQSLERVPSITGWTRDAQLCSVHQYFQQTWPHNPSYLLKVLGLSLGHNCVVDQSDRPGLVEFVFSSRTAVVEGNKTFIISIAQQLSWLAAVLSKKRKEISYARVLFTEAPKLDSSEIPSFDIKVVLEEPPRSEERGCWNSIIGPAVIVPGFPFRERENWEHGLEASVASLAAISGIQQAVTFRGGFVLKARCHAMVPLLDRGESVQWHLLDTYPNKLDWDQIDILCPDRMMQLLGTEDIFDRRAFLGFAPQFHNSLGMI